MCDAHYYRWTKYGDPTKGGPIQRPGRRPACLVAGCDREQVRRGWCTTHYGRWRLTGNASHVPRPTIREWLVDAIAKGDYRPQPCLIYPFSDSHDYPRLPKSQGATALSHLVLSLTDHPQPSNDVEVLHSCDNPPCLNPLHLRWDTHAANMREAQERNRLKNKQVGSAHHKAKLTEDSVRVLRRRYQAGERSADLAREFGVSQSALLRALNGSRWSHVK